MSSDLRDLIRNDLDRIPLPPDERWTMPRAGRGGFMSLGVVVIVIALVAIASLGGGQALQALRDRIESDRAAGGVVVPGDDYVYVSDGGPTALGGNPTQAVQTIAMPAGQSIGRFGGNTYVGTAYEGGLMSAQGDRAYLPVATSTGNAPDEYETYLQEIDLSRGLALRRISTGIASIPRALQVELPGTPIFPAATAVSSDGTNVWLVRDSGDHGRVTVVDRFDGRTLSPLAHVVLSSSGPGAVRSRVVALGPDRLAVVRQHVESLNVSASDWYFLDAQLRIVASYADDIGHRMPAGGECSTGVQASRTNTEWLLLCSDSSLFGDGALLFLDSSNFTIKATVGLPRESGFAVGMTTATDGTVYVLTGRPVVTRVDPRTHRTIDARSVIQARSWLDQLLPLVTAAKGPGGPSVAFSPDGRYAYLAGAPDQWWGSLATIDMREAKVVAHTSAYGAIGAVALSPGGERLYALATDGGGVRRIVLLAPDTLRSVGQSAPIASDPFAIFAVRGQTSAASVLATPSPTLSSATPSRDPSDLAELPQEQAVLDAFNRAGIGVRLIGASKFEGDLGVRLPARVFIVVAGSQGADILFLPPSGIGDIRVCRAAGSTISTVFVNGQLVSSSESGRPVFYLLNSRYFVTTYDPATRDALIEGLGLTDAQC